MRLTLIPVLLLAATATAQQPKAEPAAKAAAKTAEASAKKSALDALKSADEAGRDQALIAFVDGKIATNAVFSGQYSGLKSIGWDSKPRLRAWMAKAPADIKAPSDNFRQACINALRDCVEQPSDELLAELQKLATGLATPQAIATTAKYALAQFGKTEHVDKLIESAKKDSAAQDVNARFRGWSRLADVYYNIRKFKEAANAHQQVIKTVEAVNPNFAGLASSYYNCACSLALDGQKEKALEYVTKALATGKRVGQQLSVQLLKSDQDIRSLRSEQAFQDLMKKYFEGGEPAKK